MLSENKPDKKDKTDKQKLEQMAATYALNYAEDAICDAVEAAADGIPVCGIVEFFAVITGGFWDIGQNTPTS